MDSAVASSHADAGDDPAVAAARARVATARRILKGARAELAHLGGDRAAAGPRENTAPSSSSSSGRGRAGRPPSVGPLFVQVLRARAATDGLTLAEIRADAQIAARYRTTAALKTLLARAVADGYVARVGPRGRSRYVPPEWAVRAAARAAELEAARRQNASSGATRRRPGLRDVLLDVLREADWRGLFFGRLRDALAAAGRPTTRNALSGTLRALGRLGLVAARGPHGSRRYALTARIGPAQPAKGNEGT